MACPACGMPLPPGATLGHIQLVREISSGGLGSVSEAIDSTTGRLVAVKTLQPKVFSNPGFVAEFEREARITASLNHPNVAQVYEFGQEAGTYYLVMELLEHGSLASRIAKGPVPEAELLKIALDVARGLQAASAKGLLHRDVKPGNIVFDEHGRAKLVDFGLAMPLEEVGRGQGNAWGSPYYVPPERLEGVPEDLRSDIYSLGAALFHAAAGRPPFKAASASVAALKHLKAQRVSVKAFASHLSEQTAQIINRCIERRPEDRFGSYFDLISALESTQKQLLLTPGAGPAPRGDVIGAGLEKEWGLRWVIAGACVVLAIGVAVASLALRRGGKDILDSEPGPAAAQLEATSPPANKPGALALTGMPAADVVTFSPAQGYAPGDLGKHPDWRNVRNSCWEIVPGGGAIRCVHDRTEGEFHVFYRRSVAAGPGGVIRGGIRFSLDGMGRQPFEESSRTPLRLAICDADQRPTRGIEINFLRHHEHPDSYCVHVKVMPEASQAGETIMLDEMRMSAADIGDETDGPGDPSDQMDLSYALIKGDNEWNWTFEAAFVNATTGKVLATVRKTGVATSADFHRSHRYYACIRGTLWTPRLDVHEWRFAGLAPTQGDGTETATPHAGGDVDFSTAQGYAAGDLGAHPDWKTQGDMTWMVPEGAGSARFCGATGGATDAVYRPVVPLASGGMIHGTIRFSFDGFGRTVSPNYREIVKLCVCDDPQAAGRGIEMVFNRGKESAEAYSWHVRTTGHVSGTGNLGSIGGVKISSADVGDNGEAAGDPSDVLEFDYTLRKGSSEAFWSFSGRMVNVTTGKDLGAFEKSEIPTVPEFYAAPGYVGSLRSTRATARLDVTGWRFGP